MIDKLLVITAYAIPTVTFLIICYFLKSLFWLLVKVYNRLDLNPRPHPFQGMLYK